MRSGRSRRTSARRSSAADLLVAIASAAAGEDDLDAILIAALERVSRLVPCATASIAVSEGDTLRVRAEIGSGVPASAAPRRDRAELTSEVDAGQRARLMLPLLWRGQVLGRLEVSSSDAEGFSAADERVLEGTAAVLSGALELFGRYRAEVELRRDLAQANARLEAAVAESERALRVRDEFLSIASHELKTPLTPIKAAAQLLLRQGATMTSDPTRLMRNLRAIDNQVDRLRGLVDDLLDVARIQSGRLDLRCEPIDLGDLVARVVTGWDAVGRARLILQIDGSALGRWDPQRLEQVVVNLIDNALKYSSPPDPVDLLVGAENGAAFLRIADRGLGIPRPLQTTIFEPFARGAHLPRESHGGLGLGLFITREIVVGHGGGIDLESVEGGGSVFTVRLPLPGGWGQAETASAGRDSR